MDEQILIESRSARDAQLANVSASDACSILAKVKALFAVAQYQGSKLAPMSEIAAFYEVSPDVIRKAYRRHKDELAADGVQRLSGKALRGAPELLSGASTTSQVLAWTPNAALRVAMFLRDSPVARGVRDEFMRLANSGICQPAPQGDLALRTAEAQERAAKAQAGLMAAKHALAISDPAVFDAVVGGMRLYEAIEKHRPVSADPIIETVIVDEQGKKIGSDADGVSISKLMEQAGLPRKGKNKVSRQQAEEWLREIGIDVRRGEGCVRNSFLQEYTAIPRDRASQAAAHLKHRADGHAPNLFAAAIQRPALTGKQQPLGGS